MKSCRDQHGVALVMALVMLVVLSMIGVSAIRASTSSIRIVGNMQAQDEVELAAQIGIEKFLSSSTNFTTLPTSNTTYNIDINYDGTSDYTVTLPPPTCIDIVDVGDDGQYTSGYKFNHFDVKAIVTDSRTGATTTIHQGTRLKVMEYQSCV